MRQKHVPSQAALPSRDAAPQTPSPLTGHSCSQPQADDCCSHVIMYYYYEYTTVTELFFQMRFYVLVLMPGSGFCHEH